MRRVLFTTMAAASAFCSLALADDWSVTVTRPALAGYCVQSLRTVLSQMHQALSCAPGFTPQQCDKITRPIRAGIASEKRTFDLWRLYGLSLGTDDASEFLRGAAEANADTAYLKDFLASLLPSPPSASLEDVEKATKAAIASDPRIKAIQDRGAECMRGPPL